MLANRTDEPDKMEQTVKTLLRTLAVLITMMPAANAAEEEYELEFENTVCATVKKTSDGFLAVRANFQLRNEGESSLGLGNCAR